MIFDTSHVRRSISVNELRINMSGEFARVRLSRDGRPDKEQIVPFELRQSEEDKELIRWYWEEFAFCALEQERQKATEAAALLELTGQRLTTALNKEPAILDLFVEVSRNPAESRILVETDDSASGLPWELLAHENQQDRLSDQIEFVRCITNKDPTGSDAPGLIASLNILHICPPSSRPFQPVIRHLLEAFRPHQKFLKIRTLRPATFDKLQKSFATEEEYFHLIHIECADPHNILPRGSSSERVEPSELAELLLDHQVSNAIISAASPGMFEPICDWSNTMCRAGMHSVVAQPFAIDPLMSSIQWTVIYKALFNGQSMSRAVLSARQFGQRCQSRKTAYGEVEILDWASIRLFESKPVALSQPRVEGQLKLEAEPPKHMQTPARIEGGLPATPEQGFVGRDSDVLQIIDDLRARPAMLIHAVTGTGKTTLAGGILRFWAENRGPGMCLYFSFASYQPLSHICDRIGQVFTRLLNAQGVNWNLLKASEQRTATRQLLRQSPCLIIWDDFQHVRAEGSNWTSDEQNELLEFIQGLKGGLARMLILSSHSEQWMGDDLHRRALEGLDPRSSEIMLRANLSGAFIPLSPETDESALQNLLEYLLRNPLALRSLLALIVAGLDSQKIFETLRGFEATLTSANSKSGHEAYVLAALQLGLARVDPDLRQRLIVLAHFQRFADAEVLAFLCEDEASPDFVKGRSEEQWAKDLAVLAHLGLAASAGPGMYALSSSITWFVRGTINQVLESNRTALESAFTETYGQLGIFYERRYHEDPEVVMSLLMKEESNFLHALFLSLRLKNWPAVQGLLKSLCNLMRGGNRFAEWYRLIDQLAHMVSTDQGTAIKGTESLWETVCQFQAQNSEEKGDLAQAKSIYLLLKNHAELAAGGWQDVEELSPIQQEALPILASTVQKLGEFAIELNDYSEADLRYLQALVMFERLGNIAGKAEVMYQLGRVCSLKDDLEEATRWHQQVLPIWDVLEEGRQKALTLHELGMIAIKRNELNEAELWFRQVLSNWKNIKDGHRTAETQHQLGIVAEAQENLKEAEEWYLQAKESWERIDDRKGLNLTLHHLGKILRVRGKSEQAEGYLRQVLPVWIKNSNDEYKADVQYQLGLIHEKRKEYREARGMFNASAETFEQMQDPRASEVEDSLKRLGKLGMTRYMERKE
jgi:tetratricopeptide (TPR) repeat protein